MKGGASFLLIDIPDQNCPIPDLIGALRRGLGDECDDLSTSSGYGV